MEHRHHLLAMEQGMQTLLPDPQTAAARLGLLPRGDGRVRLEREGLVATLSLDHARRRNAMSVGMMLDLRECLLALESDPVSALVLHGVGGEAFCAGGDLRAVRNHLLDHAAAAAMRGSARGDSCWACWRFAA